MLGLVRVLTTEDEKVLQEHSKVMKKKYGIASISRCIPDQPNGIHSEETEKLAVPKIEKLVKDMIENDHVTAITISCAADPAVDLCRETTDVPVFGAGEVGAYAAVMVNRKIGVLGITPHVPPKIATILGDRLVAHAYPEGVRKTTDLMEEKAVGKAIEAAQSLINQGATCILFACTGFSTIGLKEELVKHVEVPIIDLVQAQAIAYSLIILKGGDYFEPTYI
ncbi:aspartate/glutamate racemase family protein [Alkalihalobacillus sp. TS-13]|uniref:aspartate/glutamate racemase family protein n=1 Tax=Alkalihalobacillus sp. TS-13 TaxID=2842455 RepID=UPI001C8768D2|nr:aspartate/glutamate racemase family protein [Alkalihalobacillus sp. TS-13]